VMFRVDLYRGGGNLKVPHQFRRAPLYLRIRDVRRRKLRRPGSLRRSSRPGTAYIMAAAGLTSHSIVVLGVPSAKVCHMRFRSVC
jgi:hypothetical protein